jgi:hypothetical protein
MKNLFDDGRMVSYHYLAESKGLPALEFGGFGAFLRALKEKLEGIRGELEGVGKKGGEREGIDRPLTSEERMQPLFVPASWYEDVRVHIKPPGWQVEEFEHEGLKERKAAADRSKSWDLCYQSMRRSAFNLFSRVSITTTMRKTK